MTCRVCRYVSMVEGAECSNPACIVPMKSVERWVSAFRSDITRETEKAQRRIDQRLRNESYRRPVFVATAEELALITL